MSTMTGRRGQGAWARVCTGADTPGGTGAAPWRDYALVMKQRLRILFCLALAVGAAAAADTRPARGGRADFAADWQAQGLQPANTRGLDLLYLRPGAAGAASVARVAPVEVELREGWQRANRGLERARLRPEEVQQLKDEVARGVGDEVREAFGPAPMASGSGTPVLQVRVLDLYLNAPDL